MSSFEFDAGDRMNTVQFAIEIYDKGIPAEHHSDLRYKNFHNEILNFRILLEALNEALTSAQARYENRKPAGGRQPYEPLSQDLEIERKKFIGNLNTTLEECSALLKKSTDSNVQGTLTLDPTQQEARLDHVRHRLQFHSQKIRLVIDRLSFKLLTDLDADVENVFAILEQNVQVSDNVKLELARFRTSWLGYTSSNTIPTEVSSDGEHAHAVSSRLAQRFSQQLLKEDFVDLHHGIPLQEGFDALLLCLEQSYEPRVEQTPEGYLQFLKAIWLLDQLKKGSEFKSACPGFYYKRAINQVQRATWERVAQPGELLSYNDTTLLSLAEHHFQIYSTENWFSKRDISQPGSLMTSGNEVFVAQIDLASDSTTSIDTVSIFKSSEERFRVMLKQSPASAQGRTVITTSTWDVREKRLIPLYALPTLVKPCLDLGISWNSEIETLRFRSLGDLLKLQTALMGFDVFYDQGNASVHCQFKFKSKFRSPLLDYVGRVQLWQESTGSASPGSRGGAPARTTEASTKTQPMPKSSSRHDSLMSLRPKSSPTDGNAYALNKSNIKLPSIAVFTQLTKNSQTCLVLLQINLSPDMVVNARRCRCYRGYDSCARLVIESDQNLSFMTYMLQSDTTAHGQPDVKTFDIFPMRLPRHPDFTRVVLSKRTEFVSFKFNSLEEKKRFHIKFDRALQQLEQRIRYVNAFDPSLSTRLGWTAEQRGFSGHSAAASSTHSARDSGYGSVSSGLSARTDIAISASQDDGSLEKITDNTESKVPARSVAEQGTEPNLSRLKESILAYVQPSVDNYSSDGNTTDLSEPEETATGVKKSKTSNSMGVPSIESLVTASENRRIEPTKVVYRLTCACGDILSCTYDEYVPGSVAKFMDALPIQEPHDASGELSPAQKSMRAIKSCINRRAEDLGVAVRKIVAESTQKSRPEDDKNPTDNNDVEMQNTVRECVRYLFICTTQWKIYKESHRSSLPMTVRRDEDFFKAIRRQYQSRTGVMRRVFGLRRLTGIRFAKFRATEKLTVVAIQQAARAEDEYPHNTDTDYLFDPNPMDYYPPVAPEVLIHLYYCPKKCLLENDCIGRMPKHRLDQLFFPNTGQDRFGFGLELTEGRDFEFLWVVGLLILCCSITFGIGWACVMKDIQGGFTVAGYLVTTLACSIGSAELYYNTP